MNGPFSIAMLVCQRVVKFSTHLSATEEAKRPTVHDVSQDLSWTACPLPLGHQDQDDIETWILVRRRHGLFLAYVPKITVISMVMIPSFNLFQWDEAAPGRLSPSWIVHIYIYIYIYIYVWHVPQHVSRIISPCEVHSSVRFLVFFHVFGHEFSILFHHFPQVFSAFSHMFP